MLEFSIKTFGGIYKGCPYLAGGRELKIMQEKWTGVEKAQVKVEFFSRVVSAREKRAFKVILSSSSCVKITRQARNICSMHVLFQKL